MTAETATRKFEHGEDSDTPVTDKARRLAEDALDAATEKAGGIERKLRDEGEKLGEEVDGQRREVGERLDETLAEVETYIRKRPVAAAGMAFAAGLLTALILRR